MNIPNSNEIHPTAVVSPSARLGVGNYIGPFCVIGPNVTIGDCNVFTSHVSVGGAPHHRAYTQASGYYPVNIGNCNTFREFSVVDGGTALVTTVTDNCFIGANSFVSHDTLLHSNVTMVNGALIGGHSIVMEGAVISFGCNIHQNTVIGAYTMLGMGTVVIKRSCIFPGRKYVGSPARNIGANKVGLERNGITEGQLRLLEDSFWQLCRNK